MVVVSRWWEISVARVVAGGNGRCCGREAKGDGTGGAVAGGSGRKMVWLAAILNVSRQ